MAIVVGGKVITGTKPYAGADTQAAIKKAITEYKPPTKKSTVISTSDTLTSRKGKTPTTPIPRQTVEDRPLSAESQSLIDALKALGITKSIFNTFTTPLSITAAAQDGEQGIYVIKRGNSVTVVPAEDVYAAATKYGTYMGDPDTSIRRLDIGCYPPTLAEAKAQYERNPIPLGSYTPRVSSTSSDTVPAPVTEDIELDPIPILPTLITRYRFTLDSGTVKEFEAMTTAEAEANVNKWNADIDTLSIIGHRPLSQHEIDQALRSAASHSSMDYARALVKYGQVSGVVPVRDGGTREAMLISEADWNSLPKEYQDIVTKRGLQALNRTIYNDLPERYRIIADDKDLETAIAAYNGDIDRANEIADRLIPYKDGDNYDIRTPLQLGVVTADDLVAAGFDAKEVKGVNAYVNRLSKLVHKWDKESQDGTFLTSANMTQGQLNDFTNATVEAGLFKKYKIGDAATEFFGMAPSVLAEKWNTEITLEDKFNVAEIYAAYPAPARLLASTYRGMITEAPNMNSAARFIKQFTLGGAAATLKPFVREQIKDNLQVVLSPYKEDGGYNITAYLKDYPEDAALLARGGIPVQELEKALDGNKIVTGVKGASAHDWAVAGLIVIAVGAGGASLLVTQPAKSGLVAASGLSQLGLGTYATVDTVKYWRQMDNTQRAIAIAFDVLLLTSGALATRGGLTRFKAEGGFLKIRDRIMYNYRSARNIIKKLLPNSKKADSILGDIDMAIRTGDSKLLQAAAKQLQLEAAKMPKQLGDPLIQRAKLLQAAPDDYIKLGDKPKAAKDLINAIKNNDAFIRNAQNALKRVKDPKRYNTVRQALEKAMLDREKLLTRVATKEKTTTASPFQRVKWDTSAGKSAPARAGQTTAIAKYKPASVSKVSHAVKSKFKLLQLGQKVRDLLKKKDWLKKKEIDKRKLAALAALSGAAPKPMAKPTPSDAARRLGVSIWDISTAIRKLPKGVQEEIALYSPAWAIVVKTKGATITATKTAILENLRQLQKQQAEAEPQLKLQPLPFPQPAPLVATQTTTTTTPTTKTKPKAKLTEKEALAIYPFFNIPTDVKTRYKRKRARLDTGEGEVDITSRLPKDRKGIITRKQGIFYVTVFPPYDKNSRIFTHKKPFYAESGKGKGSPQRTLKTVGGKVPSLVQLPMGIVTTNIKDGKVLTFTPRATTKRRRKGRRRGRLVYA